MLLACGGNGINNDGIDDGNRNVDNGSNPHRVRVTKEQFGEKWPFTVPSGEVEYIDGFAVVFHASNGTTYAMTGAAKTKGYPGIDPIWRANPDLPGLKISLHPVTKIGLDLCKK